MVINPKLDFLMISNNSNNISLKDRMKIPRQHMPEQEAALRRKNFTEVNLGLDAVLARKEASRCLTCAAQQCTQGCPVGVKIRDVVALVAQGDFLAAAAKMREDNVLPAITGRVCPQEEQCEGVCIVGKKGEPIAIGWLERFIADYERSVGKTGLPSNASPTGKKVGIIGSGPTALAAAGDLIQKGHAVTVFEALHEIGGVLVYGIPEFRLPKAIVREEVENLKRMGVEFKTNVVVGRTVTVDELFQEEGYHAILVATGAGLPNFMNIPGEQLCGVYSANEFLTRVNLMKANRFPEYDEPIYNCRDKNVAVIGGGNTALDAIRTSVRLGAKNATLVYRRSEKEMPARLEEVKHAREEGIQFMMLTNPLEFLGDDKGRLTSMKVERMELGEPDASGRRRPVPVPGSAQVLPVDVVIIAVGNRGNPLVQATTPEIKTNKWNYIEVDEKTMKTSMKGVFAGGDIVTGGATVILAMGAGRVAARAMDEFLKTGAW